MIIITNLSFTYSTSFFFLIFTRKLNVYNRYLFITYVKLKLMNDDDDDAHVL